MWTKTSCLGLCLIILMLPLPAMAACEFGPLHLEPVGGQNRYDLFAPGPFSLITVFRVRSTIVGSGCEVEVILNLDGGEPALTGPEAQRLHFEWTGVKGYRQANSWKVILSELHPEALVQMRYGAGQWLPAGNYTGALSAHFNKPDVAAAYLLPPDSMEVNVWVPPVSKIQFYGLSQQHYDLDMGVLHSNKVINSAPKLWIQSNAAYRVVLKSQYQGRLRHQSDDSRWDIPYDTLFNNRTVDLRQSNAALSFLSASSGHSVPLQLTIGDTHNRPAGRYQDTLYISIEPLLSSPP
ncbi:hypothetical protein IT774_16645 [Salinimonas marina]|uniref:Spore coat protein U domain-containing protein n=1 Tax=Salinimonas marina TaxID=2785918 RepID=A0A7S9DXJ2_9ALTE|nr:hypothetical protein [Salinimonas marina]QPG05672.1 hypothetical protein IT774_16645 [Salinimonas marina]